MCLCVCVCVSLSFSPLLNLAVVIILFPQERKKLEFRSFFSQDTYRKILHDNNGDLIDAFWFMTLSSRVLQCLQRLRYHFMRKFA
mmetsp:Transcript_9533/g.10481  ORF Transcript_9533/g.10481 Transcript_9533/m.10481 type:complete len:85 (+) Transcript_9533:755-1009(+)